MRIAKTDVPVISVRETAGGGRLVRVIADLDRCLDREGSFEHALILSNAVKWAAAAEPVVQLVGGMGQVYVNHYRKGERHIVHLNSRLTTHPTPGGQDVLIPVGPINVLFRSDGKAWSVGSHVSETRPETELRPGGRLAVTVPEIRDHEVLVFDRTDQNRARADQV